jgi:hypothetical protein
METRPFSLVEHDGEVNIITQKVHGTPLVAALGEQIPGILEKTDELICGQLGYLKDKRAAREGIYPHDAVGIEQFMFGHLAGESAKDDRIIYVDLDPSGEAFVPVEELHDSRKYLREIGFLAQDTLQAESLVQAQGMVHARQSIREEFANIIDEVKTAEPAVAQNARAMLEAFDVGDLEKIELEEL